MIRYRWPASLQMSLVIVDLVVVLVALYAAAWLRSTLPYGQSGALDPAQAAVPWPVYLLALASWGLALGGSGAYDPRRVLRWYQEGARVSWASVQATVLLAGLLYLSFRETSRLQFLYAGVLTWGGILAVRAVLRASYRWFGSRRSQRTRVLILGAGQLGIHVASLVLDFSRWGLDLVGFLDDDPAKRDRTFGGRSVLGPLDRLASVIESAHVDEVWVALPPRAYERLHQVVTLLEAHPVRIKIVPDYLSLAIVRAKTEMLGDIPLIGLREPVIEGWARIVKRWFDVTVSAVLMILFAPLMLLIAAAIRLEGCGPVLLGFPRAGENGRRFRMLKFRSMAPEAAGGTDQAKAPESVAKRRDDPRVTRVGRFLRRFSLDELPQLWNVLRGDMSLVGPRPEQLWLVDKYEPWQRKRFAVPQGITGWWQINGRSDRPMHLNTEDDLYYVYNYSLLLDIWILLRTPLVVLQGRGAF